MERIYLSLLCITLCFTTVQLLEYSRRQQINFLENEIQKMRFWRNQDVSSRQVYIDGKKTSINDFLQLSTISQRKWPVEKHNVIELNHLINSLLACEYCDLINYYTRYMLKFIDDCQNTSDDDISTNQKNIKRNPNSPQIKLERPKTCVEKAIDHLKIFLKQLSNFIYTLAHYKDIRSDEKFSNRDELKILLSWYIQMQNIISIDISLLNKITNSLKLIGEQLLIVIKEFDIQYCRFIKESLDFNEELSSDNSQTILRKLQPKLKLYVDINYFPLGFVFDLDHHYKFLEIIENNTNLKVNHNNNYLSPKELFDQFIKSSTSVQAILQYVNFMVGLITRLVYRKVIDTLEPLFNVPFNDDTVQSMTDTITIVNEFLISEHHLLLPEIFCNEVKVLYYRLLSLIQNLKLTSNLSEAKVIFDQIRSTNKISFSLLNTHILIEPDATDDKWFLNFTIEDLLQTILFQYIDGIYLNRKIMNVLLDQSFLTLPVPFEYAFDYKTVYNTEHSYMDSVECPLCISIRKTSERAKVVLRLLNDFSESVKQYSTSIEKGLDLEQDVESCYIKLNEIIEELKWEVIHMTLASYEDPQYIDIDYQLQKLFLTFVYNEKYVSLFKIDTQKNIDVDRIQHFITFQEVFCDQLDKLAVTCGKSIVENQNDDSMKRQFSNMNLKSYIEIAFKKEPQSMESTHIKDIELCFSVLDIYAEFISNNIERFQGSQIKFYWKGKPKTIEVVLTEFTDSTFDVQDLIEFQYLTIRWVACSVLSLFLNILNGVYYYNLKFDQDKFRTLLETLEYFVSLLEQKFPNRPILLTIKLFKFINVDKDDEKTGLRQLIINELKLLGVVLPTLPILRGSNTSEHVHLVSDNMEVLKISNFSNLIKLAGLEPLFPVSSNTNIEVL